MLHRYRRPGEKDTHYFAVFIIGVVVGVVFMGLLMRFGAPSGSDVSVSAYKAGSYSVTASNAKYIGNQNSYVFHKTSCSSVKQMNSSNKVYFASRQDAVSAGFHGCQRCNP